MKYTVQDSLPGSSDHLLLLLPDVGLGWSSVGTGEEARDSGLVRMLCLLRNVLGGSLGEMLVTPGVYKADSFNMSERTGRQVGSHRNTCWGVVLGIFHHAAMSDPLNILLDVRGYHFKFKKITGPGEVAQTCNPSAWEVEAENFKFLASLSYMEILYLKKANYKAGGCSIVEHSTSTAGALGFRPSTKRQVKNQIPTKYQLQQHHTHRQTDTQTHTHTDMYKHLYSPFTHAQQIYDNEGLQWQT